MNTLTTYSDTLWGVRRVEKSSGELLSLLENKEFYIPFIERFKLESRKCEWLMIRVLLKELLGEEKEISYDDNGKPFLEDRSYFVSFSHTRGYVAVIANPTHPVGIDIEEISQRIYRVKERFMSEEELMNLSEPQELIHLLLHWSAKETLFKALGQQSVDFTRQLHVNRFEPRLIEPDCFSAYETRTGENHHFMIRYIANSEYVLTFTEL